MTHQITFSESESKPIVKKSLGKRLAKHKMLYLMIAPGLLFLFIYKYIPMFGMIISFQDYKPYLGIAGSEWVGLKHFERLFTSSDFWMILKNTLVLFGLQIVILCYIRIHSIYRNR